MPAYTRLLELLRLGDRAIEGWPLTVDGATDGVAVRLRGTADSAARGFTVEVTRNGAAPVTSLTGNIDAGAIFTIGSLAYIASQPLNFGASTTFMGFERRPSAGLQTQGYVIVPSGSNPRTFGRALSGFAGATLTGQDADGTELQQVALTQFYGLDLTATAGGAALYGHRARPSSFVSNGVVIGRGFWYIGRRGTPKIPVTATATMTSYQSPMYITAPLNQQLASGAELHLVADASRGAMQWAELLDATIDQTVLAEEGVANTVYQHSATFLVSDIPFIPDTVIEASVAAGESVIWDVRGVDEEPALNGVKLTCERLAT